MNKDFTKKKLKHSSFLGSQSHHGFPRKNNKSSLIKLWFAILLVTISFVGFICYSEIKWQFFSNHFPMVAKLPAWVNARYDAFQQKKSYQKNKPRPSVQKMAVADTQIQFEFYNTLPNMQMKPTLLENNENNKIIASKKEETTLSDQNDTILPNAKINTEKLHSLKSNQQKTKNRTKKMVANVFSDPDELVQELSKHIKQLYVVQMGIFQTHESARRFSTMLSQKGFDTNIISSLLSGKKVFRVQSGPFDKNEAMVMRKRLQKRNVKGLIRPVHL